MPPVRPLPSVSGPPSRRDFLATSAGALIAGVTPRPANAAATGAEIRVGLIGCGGRGTGAAVQAAAADPGVRIVALGDLFSEQVASAAHVLARDAGRQFTCPATARFAGVDAHRRVFDAGVDAVLIAAPPHLRPLHVEAAVAAGVHVFCETPAAIDLPGTLRVARALARVAGRTIASGLHARRDEELAALVGQVREGSIGRPRRIDVHATLGAPWRVSVRPGCSAAEARLRNWAADDSLSGGHFVERHVHALDRGLWLLGDRVPDIAEPLPVHAADGVAVRFLFADGAEMRASSTRGGGVPHGVRETVSGSRGSLHLRSAADGRRFQATMDAFLRSIRSESGMDDSGILIRGSLVAVMGRLASARGRSIAWGEMLAGDSQVFPVRQIGRDVNLTGV